jgi:hypothetical protein
MKVGASYDEEVFRSVFIFRVSIAYSSFLVPL